MVRIHLYMLMSWMKMTSRLASTENWHGKDTFVYGDVTREDDVKVS